MSGLAVGERIPARSFEAEPGPMKTMAVLLRDPNPIHWDTEVTAALGLGDRPVNQGPINMSYLLEAVIGAAGAADRVRRFQVRFLGNVFAGERVECGGVVSAVDTEAGIATIELEATVGDRPVLGGVAEVRL